MSGAAAGARTLACRLLAHRTVLLIALFAAALAAAWAAGSGHGAALVARTALLALAAASLSFLIGQAGLVSFGHAAPLGIGAYCVLILGEYEVRNILVVLPAAFAAGAAFAAITGLVALRTRGIYFIMITLAFAQMMFYVAASLSAFGGDDGMAIAGRSTFFGDRILRTDTQIAVWAVALLAAGLVLLERISASRFGLMLRTGRENEAKLEALGLDPFRHRLIALALASGIAGVAGAMLANQVDYVSPSLMNWHISGELIVMVVLGGAARISGAVIGAIVVVALDEALAPFTAHWKLGLGLVIVAAVLLRGADIGALIGRPAKAPDHG